MNKIWYCMLCKEKATVHGLSSTLACRSTCLHMLCCRVTIKKQVELAVMASHLTAYFTMRPETSQEFTNCCEGVPRAEGKRKSFRRVWKSLIRYAYVCKGGCNTANLHRSTFMSKSEQMPVARPPCSIFTHVLAS